MRTARETEGAGEAWLTRLIDQHQSALLRMCFMYLHDRALAEDAVQETFLKAYRARDTFRRDCSEKTWLARIAINACRDMRRAAWFRHTDRRVTPEDVPAQSPPPQEDDAEALALAIVRLPAKYREVILLYYYQDMTMKEVAASLGIAVSSVSGRLKRACARLHEALEKEGAHG